jgi:glycosyltransferase involved in cell wall biosynthesis
VISAKLARRPKVSIGLPVYNGERYLDAAIASLLAQTFVDFELILCDNASTDETARICEKYAHQDARVRYFRESRNTGVIRNHNRTIELSVGEYFKWAAHDDVHLPRFLESCVATLESTPEAVLAFPRTRLIDENGNAIRDYPHPLDLSRPARIERFLQYVGASHILVEDYGLMRNSILKSTPLLGNYAWSDMVLFAELALYGTFVEVPEVLFYRREHLQRSMYAHKDAKSLTVSYDPKKNPRRIFPTWRIYRGHLETLKRAPLSVTERSALIVGLARRANWQRRRLVNEVLSALTISHGTP